MHGRSVPRSRAWWEMALALKADTGACAASPPPRLPFFPSTGHGTFDLDFSARMWNWYMLIKHSSEWLILSLMLWMLHVPSGGQAPPSYYSEGDALYGEDEEEASRGAGDAPSSAGENDYWDRPGSHAGYGVEPTGSQPLNQDGRSVDEYGSI